MVKKTLEEINAANIKIRFLDVGQGDCTLVQTSSRNMLIDTGPREAYGSLIAKLTEYEATTLNYVIITHPHIGHDGNLLAMLQPDSGITINAVYTNGIDLKEGSLQQQYKTALGDKYRIMKQGDTLSLGNALSWTTLWPTTDFIAEMQEFLNSQTSIPDHSNVSKDNNNVYTSSGDPVGAAVNNSSIVGKLVHSNGFSALFPGDCQYEVIKKLSDEQAESLPSTIYKMARHGAYYSNLNTYLRTVAPELFIITGGDSKNPYPVFCPEARWDYVYPKVSMIDRLIRTLKIATVETIYCTRFHNDIHISVHTDDFGLYVKKPDRLWAQIWRERCNRYIQQTEPGKTPYYFKTSYFDDPSMLTITVINVGVGDAILIKTDKQTVLIDTGNYNNAFDNKGKLFEEAMKRYNVTHIDKIFITHPHGDHDGNFGPLLSNKNRFPNTVIDSNTTVYHGGILIGNKQRNLEYYCSEQYRGKGNAVNYQRLWKGPHTIVNDEILTVNLGTDVDFHIYGPNKEFLENTCLWKRYVAAGGLTLDAEEDEGGGDVETLSADKIAQYIREKQFHNAKLAYDNGTSLLESSGRIESSCVDMENEILQKAIETCDYYGFSNNITGLYNLLSLMISDELIDNMTTDASAPSLTAEQRLREFWDQNFNVQVNNVRSINLPVKIVNYTPSFDTYKTQVETAYEGALTELLSQVSNRVAVLTVLGDNKPVYVSTYNADESKLSDDNLNFLASSMQMAFNNNDQFSNSVALSSLQAQLIKMIVKYIVYRVQSSEKKTLSTNDIELLLNKYTVSELLVMVKNQSVYVDTTLVDQIAENVTMAQLREEYFPEITLGFDAAENELSDFTVIDDWGSAWLSNDAVEKIQQVIYASVNSVGDVKPYGIKVDNVKVYDGAECVKSLVTSLITKLGKQAAVKVVTADQVNSAISDFITTIAETAYTRVTKNTEVDNELSTIIDNEAKEIASYNSDTQLTMLGKSLAARILNNTEINNLLKSKLEQLGITSEETLNQKISQNVSEVSELVLQMGTASKNRIDYRVNMKSLQKADMLPELGKAMFANLAVCFENAMYYIKSVCNTGTVTVEQDDIAEMLVEVLANTATDATSVINNAIAMIVCHAGKRLNNSANGATSKTGITKLLSVPLTQNPTRELSVLPYNDRTFSVAKQQYEYSINDLSITGKLVYKNFSIMLTGDVDQRSWGHICYRYGKYMGNAQQQTVNDPKSLRATILKTAHHTSTNNTTPLMWRVVLPEAVVSTCAGYFRKFPRSISTSSKSIIKSDILEKYLFKSTEGMYGTWSAYTPRALTLYRAVANIGSYDNPHPYDKILSTRHNHDITIKTNGDTYWLMPDLNDSHLPLDHRYIQRYRNALQIMGYLQEHDFGNYNFTQPDDEES